MRICVFGAGAVGGFLAAKLAHAGHEVSAVARGAQLAAFQANGVRLKTANEDIQAPLKASDRPADLGPQDAVIFTTKAHSLKEAAEASGPLIGPDTALVFAQNGIPWWYAHGFEAPGLQPGPNPALDPDGAIWRGFGPERSVGAVIHSPNAVSEPGVIVNNAKRPPRLLLGAPDGVSRPEIEALSAALIAVGVEAPVLPDIRRAVWSKLILNVSAAPCAVLTGGAIKSFLEDPGMQKIAASAMAEAIAVAAAHGFELDVDIAANVDPANRPNHKPSMLQDLEAGRQMEVDPILGSVHGFAKAAGVPTPTIDVLLPLLRTRARLAGLYNDTARLEAPA